MKNIRFSKYFVILLNMIFVAVISIYAFASSVDIPNTFTAGQTAKASEVNNNFNSLETAVDDNDSRITTNANNISLNTNNISSNDTDIADLSNRSWGKSGNDLYYDTGSVGIGTTSPIEELHIVESDDTSAGISLDHTGTGGRDYRILSTGNNPVTGIAPGMFSLYDADAIAHRFVVDGNGNIGIGTTVPNAPLSLGLNQLNFDAFDTNANYDFADPQSEPSTVKGLGSIVIDFDNNANTTTQIFAISHDDGIEVFRIEDNGNVGIGTTSPGLWAAVYSYPVLEVNGTLAVSGDSTGTGLSAITSEGGGLPLLLKARPGNNPDLVVATNGNVGIGTTSPIATLDVNGYMKLSKNVSEPATCDVTQDGSLALTSGYRMCVCDGTNWVFTSDGITSCSW